MPHSKSAIIKAKDGEAFWQSSTKGDCITIKVSPWNIKETNHTIFLHELPKGGSVTEHSHENNEEIFICLDGEATLTLDGVANDFKKHDVAYLAPMTRHSIRTTSETPLKFMVIISPTGLEERLKLMGIPKKTCDETPPDAFDSPIGKQNTHGVVR